MKTSLIILVLGAAMWLGMKRLHETAVAKQITEAPAAYTRSLQDDVSRAQKSADAAAKAAAQVDSEVRQAVDAAH